MTIRIYESTNVRKAACVLAACMLLSAPGCALLKGKQQEQISPETAVADTEEARPQKPYKEQNKSAPEPAPSQKEAKPAPKAEADDKEMTAALEPEPDFGVEKTYTLNESKEDREGVAMVPDTSATIPLGGEGPYPTSSDLQIAADTALSEGRVLGGIESFDAFPDIPGKDTVGQVFREKNHPGTRIKLFAFHAPGQEYDRVIYGYIVEDTVHDEVTGYFDEDLDGVFERVTLKPVIKPTALFAN